MRVISQESMMFGSNSVFYHWEPYEIPASGLNMLETEEIVERFNRNNPLEGPMRSRIAQLAADAVQSIVALDSTVAVGAAEKSGKRRGRHKNDPIPQVVVLADITMPQYWQAMESVFGAPIHSLFKHPY